MDRRDYEAEFGRKDKIDEKRMVMLVETVDDDGNEIILELPFKWEVCSLCNGRGKHVNPSIDSNGLTYEDFAEDPDFAESYFSGMYDQSCNCCGGKRVEPVVDEDKANPDDLEKYYGVLQSDSDYAKEVMAERRYMGY